MFEVAHGNVLPLEVVRSEVAAILAEHAHQAGQFSVLGPDPWRVIVNVKRDGFIAFLEARRAIVSWRSPVGPDTETRARLLGALNDHAERVKKALYVLEVDQATADAGVNDGMIALQIGFEAYLDLSWSLRGKRREKVRLAMNFAARHGVSWREAHPQTVTADAAGLEVLEQRWKAERKERRVDSFLRTSWSELMASRRYFVAEHNGRLVASIACSPVSSSGWYLQDPVREPSALRGALEGAMALSLDTLRDEGYRMASNGPLPFWSPTGETKQEYQLGFLGNRLVSVFDHRYRFAGNNQFRSKFEPDWIEPAVVLRSRRALSPGKIASLIKLVS
jgi:lysylphosphatidylglycerol synthetase-like protein (DUF2156 family)